MKAAIGPPDDETGWASELKWDGLRTQVATDGIHTTIRSSTGRDVTAQFPDLGGFGPHIGTTAVLDGETVVFDGDRPSFQKVLHRLNVDRPTQRVISDNPAVFVVFDLLHLDGNDLIELPYRVRRRLLDDFLDDGPFWRVSPWVEEGSAQLLALAHERDLEGIVMKRLDSVYKPGGRSHDWRKIKVRPKQEFVVGGWLAGQGALEDNIGSLVLGVWVDGRLEVAGLAGSGLTDDERDRLAACFTERPDPPFAAVPPLDRRPTWVEPDVVVEIEFGDWPTDGMLRHPVYLGQRVDVVAEEVRREVPPPGGTT
jgi:bifunctional non-homologous end joining protein LigD